MEATDVDADFKMVPGGSLFGVGVPEAAVIGLLGWFLLGPEELYRLAKVVGGWLGELRTYVGQAARQYESALDDESTRKAIEGIRETQRTLSEVSSSWRSVADSLRDPLALGSTLESTYAKYTRTQKDTAVDTKKAIVAKVEESSTLTVSAGYPDLNAADTSQAEESQAEDLEAKRAASREAAKDLWFTNEKASPRMTSSEPRGVEGYLEKLNMRLEELDDLSERLDELRAGILEDRAAMRLALPEAKATSAAGHTEEQVVAAAAPPVLEALTWPAPFAAAPGPPPASLLMEDPAKAASEPTAVATASQTVA